MSDADPEQEAPGERARDVGALRGDVGRLVLPHVEDPRGDRQRARALQERPRLRHRRAAADPQRAVAEGLDLGDAVKSFLMAPPDADRAEVHSHTLSRPVTPSG
jgi:hypothetical protein